MSSESPNTCFLELVVCIGEKMPVPAELDYTNGIDMFIPTFINDYKSVGLMCECVLMCVVVCVCACLHEQCYILAKNACVKCPFVQFHMVLLVSWLLTQQALQQWHSAGKHLTQTSKMDDF